MCAAVTELSPAPGLSANEPGWHEGSGFSQGVTPFVDLNYCFALHGRVVGFPL